MAVIARRSTPRTRPESTLGAVSALAVVIATATEPARAQGAKPPPWQPKTSAGAETASGSHTVDAPAGVVRPIAPLYQPAVPDSILPFHPVYRELAPAEALTATTGALRQGQPARRYWGVGVGKPVSLAVDGGNGGSHLALVILLPWIDRVAPSVACPTDLVFRLDGGADQASTLWFTPGPVLFSAGHAPLAVSTPGLVTIPLPPGRHFVEFKFANTPASYVLFQLGQPEIMPLPVMPGR